MTNDELRQFAMLQLEMVLEYQQGLVHSEAIRLEAALYCVQAMDGGPRPEDFDELIEEVSCLDDGEGDA